VVEQKKQSSKYVCPPAPEMERRTPADASSPLRCHPARVHPPTLTARCSDRYSKSDVLILKAIFDDYDADGGGCVTISELSNALEAQKMEKVRLCIYRIISDWVRSRRARRVYYISTTSLEYETEIESGGCA